MGKAVALGVSLLAVAAAGAYSVFIYAVLNVNKTYLKGTTDGDENSNDGYIKNRIDKDDDTKARRRWVIYIVIMVIGSFLYLHSILRQFGINDISKLYKNKLPGLPSMNFFNKLKCTLLDLGRSASGGMKNKFGKPWFLLSLCSMLIIITIMMNAIYFSISLIYSNIKQLLKSATVKLISIKGF